MRKICRAISIFLLSVLFASVLASCGLFKNGASVEDTEASESVGEYSNTSESSTSKENGKKPSSKNEGKDGPYDYFPVISDVMPKINISTPDKSNAWATQYGQSHKRAGLIDYVDAAITVEDCEEEYQMSDVTAQVKVRGNYTLEYSKKPIRIKFTEKSGLLGLHDGEKYRNWVLLADWKDLSMSNNTVAFYLGNTILGSDGYYCTDFRNVEVYLNGQYWGVYLLAEQQEAEGNRTSVSEVENGYKGTDIGYLFEFDGYYTDELNMPNGKGDPTFTMTYAGSGSYQKGYTVKSDIYDNSQVDFLQNYMNNAYSIAYMAINNNAYYTFNSDYSGIKNANGKYSSAKETVAAVIDIQSLVDIYILNEIACDADVAWSSFYMSLDMSSGGNKRITFEAPWDFDSSFGIKKNTCNDAQGLFALNSDNPWFKLVAGEEWFLEMVCEKWAEIKENKVPQGALDLVETQKLVYKKNYIRNYNKWHERMSGNGELIQLLNTYNDPSSAQWLASEYLYDWLTKRFAYLDSVWVKETVEDEAKLPENATKYRYEAENAILTDGFDGKSIRTNRSYASCNSYVGDVHEGRTITFVVNSDEAANVVLFAGISKPSYSQDFSSCFIVKVNGRSLSLPIRTVPAITGSEEEWHTFISFELTGVELQKGENTISFTAIKDTMNFDYIDIYSAVGLF